MGASVSVERACLLVKQPVSIFPARTQLPGVRVLLIVHSVHTSGTRDPGRMGTNYVPSRSLPVPWRPPCALPTSFTRICRAEGALEAGATCKFLSHF